MILVSSAALLWGLPLTARAQDRAGYTESLIQRRGSRFQRSRENLWSQIQRPIRPWFSRKPGARASKQPGQAGCRNTFNHWWIRFPGRMMWIRPGRRRNESGVELQPLGTLFKRRSGTDAVDSGNRASASAYRIFLTLHRTSKVAFAISSSSPTSSARTIWICSLPRTMPERTWSNDLAVFHGYVRQSITFGRSRSIYKPESSATLVSATASAQTAAAPAPPPPKPLNVIYSSVDERGVTHFSNMGPRTNET